MKKSVFSNNVFEVGVALSSGVDINTRDQDGKTALICAAEKGSPNLVRYLLHSSGIDVNLKDNHCYTALMHAEAKGFTNIADKLRPLTDVSFMAEEAGIALLYSARCGHIHILPQLLFVPGIDVNIKCRNGKSVLMIAAESGHYNIAKELLSSPGLDVSLKDDYCCYTALMYAEAKGFVSIADMLRPLTDIKFTSEEAGKALLYAAKCGHESILKQMLGLPIIDINIKANNCGKTALMLGIEEGHDQIVQHLLSYKSIDVNIRDKLGYTSLILAIEGGYSSIVKKLLNVPGIDVNSLGSNKKTALMYAVIKGSDRMVRYILSSENVDVNARDNSQKTVLMWAAFKGNDRIMKRLLAIPNIDVNARASLQETALMYSILQSNYKAFKMLLSFPGIDINAQDKSGGTALMLAAFKGNHEMVKDMLGFSNIDVGIKDIVGATAFMLAVERSHSRAVELLLSFPKLKLSNSDVIEALEVACSKGSVATLKLLFAELSEKNIDLSIVISAMLEQNLSEKVLKYLLYSGIMHRFKSLFDEYYSNILPKYFWDERKEMLYALSKLTAPTQFSTNPTQVSRFACLKLAFSFFSKRLSHRVAPIMLYRLELLEARVYGVEFAEDITTFYARMSMPKFRAVSILMKSSVCAKLAHNRFHSYIFSHMLMLRSIKKSKFENWSFDLRAYFLEFIVGDRLSVAREEFFALKKELAASVVSSNVAEYVENNANHSKEGPCKII